MIGEFQQYLVDNGFLRYRYVREKKTVKIVEDYDSIYISTYGPTEYVFERGEVRFYWGLGIAGHGPYYYYPAQEQYKWVLSGDNEKDLQDIINGKINKVLIY